MKKHNNQDVTKGETSFATGICPNNCSACLHSGCVLVQSVITLCLT